MRPSVFTASAVRLSPVSGSTKMRPSIFARARAVAQAFRRLLSSLINLEAASIEPSSPAIARWRRDMPA